MGLYEKRVVRNHYQSRFPVKGYTEPAPVIRQPENIFPVLKKYGICPAGVLINLDSVGKACNYPTEQGIVGIRRINYDKGEALRVFGPDGICLFKYPKSMLW